MPYRPTAATRQTALDKRARLVDAGRVIVAADGFGGATVASIAAAAGVSVGSVYSHFDNREVLLAEVFRHAAQHEFGHVERAVTACATPDEQLAALIDTFADRAIRGRQLAWSLLFEPTAPAVDEQRLRYRRSYRDLGERIVVDGVATGVFVPQDAAVVAAALMGAISESLVGALNSTVTDPLSIADHRQLTRTIHTFCFRALGARTTEEHT